MVIADRPSVVTLPRLDTPCPSILEFLCHSFPGVPRPQWEARMRTGKLLDDDGNPITPDTAYIPGKRIFYFREVDQEPVIPGIETILFRNDQLLVACKPHFLPVTPGGRFVNECLLNRLRRRTGIAGLAPVHRIDRETAGVVVFSVNPETRGRYHDLFMHGQAEKIYAALAELTRVPDADRWTVESRLVRDEPRFRMRTVSGTANARSIIELLDIRGSRGRFRLQPLTGKTHQLRVHMGELGFPIVNDRYYPELQPQTADDFGRPLQLLAKSVRFRDPVTGRQMEFSSERELE